MALTVRTDPELEAALTALASAEGSSRQEVIRRAVLDRYAPGNVHDGRVDEASTRMIGRWADVLDRLGSA